MTEEEERAAPHRHRSHLGRAGRPWLGVAVDEAKVERYHRLYRERGQFLPYQPAMFGRADAS